MIDVTNRDSRLGERLARFVLLLVAWFVAVDFASDSVAGGTGDSKPNIVVILADDLGFGDLGCYGAKEIRTPILDRMAAEGMRFTSFYAQPFCGPTRSALMTGCYPLRLAELGNRKHHMPVPHVRESLLSEILQRVGYATAQIGKWDLAGHAPDHLEYPENAPLQRGFDRHFGTPASNDWWDKTALLRDGVVGENPVDLTESTTKRYADEAIRFIRERKGKPFFIYLCPNMPHTALHAGAEFRNKSPRGLYGDVVEELDHYIGRILETLRFEGIEKNTIVLFASDNGPWLLQKENGGSAGPLRGGKTSIWEGGVRVPAIAWAPGRIAGGQTCARIATILDVLPTFAKLAGATLPEHKLDGRDLSAWLLNGPPNDEDQAAYFYHVNTHLQAVRQGHWKLHLRRPYPVPWLTRGIQRAHVAEADRFEIKTPLLFDLDSDIGEMYDVAAQHPEVVRELLTLADKARTEIGDYDRIGAEARFFDAGPPRPDMHDWRQEPENAAQSNNQPAETPLTGERIRRLDETFEGELAKDWFWSLGTWRIQQGVLRGYESGPRRHGPVMLRRFPLRDGVVECEFRLEGKATFAGIIFNGSKERGHIVHLVIGKDKLRVIAHPTPGEKEELLSAANALSVGEWHRVKIEFQGPRMTATVNDRTFAATNPAIAEEKLTFGLDGDSGGPEGEKTGALEFRKLTVTAQ